MVVDRERGFKNCKTLTDGRQKVRKRWEAPGPSTAELNVDGAFGREGDAGIGIALRDDQGEMIVADCRDATEAELMTIKK